MLDLFVSQKLLKNVLRHVRIWSGAYCQQCCQAFAGCYDWHGSSDSIVDEIHCSCHRLFIILDVIAMEAGRWEHGVHNSNRNGVHWSTCFLTAPEKHRHSHNKQVTTRFHQSHSQHSQADIRLQLTRIVTKINHSTLTTFSSRHQNFYN